MTRRRLKTAPGRCSWCRPAFLLLVLSGLAPGRTASAAAADSEVVAWLPFSLSKNAERSRVVVEGAALDGLRSSGLSIVEAPAVLRDCADGCLPRLQSEGLAYVVRGSVVFKAGAQVLQNKKWVTKNAQYTIRMAVQQTSDGAEIGTEDMSCGQSEGVCPPIPEVAARLGASLGQKARNWIENHRARPKVAALPERTTTRQVTAPVPPTSASPAIPSPVVTESNHTESHWPWVTTGVISGAAAIAGFYLLAINGNELDCQDRNSEHICPRKRTTKWQGLALVGVGITGGLIVGGHYLLSGPSQSPQATLSLGLDGISVRGRF